MKAALWAGILAVCFSGAKADPITGADVDESKVVKTYYVDPSNADSVDDADHGTEDAPFKTIARGLKAATSDQDRGVGARLVIADGVYREAVRVPPSAPSAAEGSAPLVIEAANREQAIIEGADATGWEAASWKQEGAAWTHGWPFEIPPRETPKRPSPSAPIPPCKPLESRVLVFLHGQALRQVGEPAELTAGAFCLVAPPPAPKGRRSRETPPSPASGLLITQPNEGGAMDGAEVSARDGGFTLEGRRNVVIRGITVQHVAGGSRAALTVSGCSNVLIDDVLCQWNNDAGLRVAGRTSAPWSSGITLRRVRLLFNGGSGLAASNLKNLVVDDSETSFNGFRGQWNDCIDPAGPAGTKVGGIHGGIWRRHHAVGNSARGMSWTGDCAGIEVEDSFVRANLLSGLLFENSPGPFAVRRCVIAGAKLHSSARDDAAFPAGISICAASDVQLESNIIAGNEMPQLGVWDVAARSDGTNFETGERETCRSERHRYRHNVFCGLAAEQPIFSLPTVDRSGKASFDFYYASLDSDGNCYWNAALPESFCSFDKGNVRRPGVELANWRTFLASKAGAEKTPEAASIWADPLFSDPAEGDFRLKEGSPAADWGLPSDEGTPGQ